jgi:hypothetical protein
VRLPVFFVKARGKTKGLNAPFAMVGGFRNVAHVTELVALANHNQIYANRVKELVQVHSPAPIAKARD